VDSRGRDLGLRRLSVITRWSVGGAVVLTGVFSALVGHARPGHASAATTVTTSPDSGDTFLQPPARLPRARGGGGVVTSGAS
jgi:hypothetical protein